MKKAILYAFALLAMTVCLGVLSGCNETKKTVFVEAGSTARVATDSPCSVCVKDKDGTDHCEKRNIGGMIVMPKTNYDELRRGYLSNSIKREPDSVAPQAPPVKPVIPKTTPQATPLSPVDVQGNN